MFSPIHMDSEDQTKKLGYNSRQNVSGRDEPMSEANMNAKLHYQLENLTKRLADRDRKIDEFKNEMKKY